MRGSHVNAAAVAAEQEKAFALKSAGATYRQIGEALGISTATAHRRVTAACTEHVVPELEHYRRITDEAYDRMIRVLAPAVAKGDVKAVDAARRVWADRRRMFGLDAPVVTEVNIAARIDVEVEETAAATSIALAAVFRVQNLDARTTMALGQYGMAMAAHHYAPPGTPEPEPPRLLLALMPGDGSVSPSEPLSDDPGPWVPPTRERSPQDEVQAAMDRFTREFPDAFTEDDDAESA